MYTAVKLNLTKSQRDKILNGTCTLKLSSSALQGDKDTLYVTSTMSKRINKCKEKQGCTLKISEALRKANMKKGDGIFSMLLPFAVKGYQKLQDAHANSSDGDKFRKRLEYLRGNGTYNDGLQLGIDYKKGDKDAIKMIKLLKKEGLNGNGFWSDLWGGIKQGFTDPIGSIELLGREISNAINKPKKGAGIKFY